ncbi:TPR-like protein [Exidia glandulosa HHB12029]|uniref:TPR-like protein n=1 Tax=Exidia glandulosa HHB12029 TaxID=1314781 RepID=A0A166N9Q5_EXIGL|nr:TPR-like protein [Exidia glandulosa HHB12029]
MAASTPPRAGFSMPPVPRLQSPSHTRNSISSSFSLGPQSLVQSLMASGTHDSPALDPNRSLLHASPLQSSPRPQRRRQGLGSVSRHPLANDHQMRMEPDEEEEDYEWGRVDRMRLWRHDAITQHLYTTAAFWGDKVLSFTNDPNDAFWLAQSYFLANQYARAEQLLTRPFAYAQTDSPIVEPMLNGKGKGRADALAALEAPVDKPPGSPFIQLGTDAGDDNPQRLVDISISCRYLAAQCQVRQGKWPEALETLGEANPWRNTGKSGANIPNMDGGIKLDSSMCHLRGLLMLKMNRTDKAKECFLEALLLDVKNYEAFDVLVTGEMMSIDEEWEVIQSLSYAEHARDEAEFVKMMYTIRLKKYKHFDEMALARRRLVQEYSLIDNPDVLHGFADALYAQFRWADCFAITSRILALVNVHPASMPLHVACMHHMSYLQSKLFMLAHELVDKEPEAAMSWYAVGVWYLTRRKWADARKFFSKTSLMDPRFAPAWIAFAHSFALEGEHDHAITAYSTCARLFQGTHLPLMFVGMEHIRLSHFDAADDALNAAYKMCDSDPLLVNEMGVMAYNRGNYEKAVKLLERAMELASVVQSSRTQWVGTQVNLGSAYRKMGRLQDAKRMYQQVLEIDPRNGGALAYLGMVYHMSDELDQAILTYHEALSVDPTNQHVLDLLNVALESNIDSPPFARAAGAEMWNAIVKERHDARGRVYGVTPAEAALLQAEISRVGPNAGLPMTGDDSAMDLSVDSTR